MASPSRIYRIYARVAEQAPLIADFEQAAGRELSGTLKLLLAGDRAKPLARWAEEMGELCGVLDGTHEDSYLLEASQCFYWASIYAAMGGARWEDLGFDQAPRDAARSGITTTAELTAAAERLAGLGPDGANPAKLFLLWCVGDALYRAKTPPEDQWSIAQIMEKDLQDMKKRAYLLPILREVAE